MKFKVISFQQNAVALLNCTWSLCPQCIVVLCTDASLEEATYDPFKSMSVDSATTYFPFGKPGGGAPLKSDEGKVAPNRRGVDFNRELDTSADVKNRRDAADKYLVELSKFRH